MTGVDRREELHHDFVNASSQDVVNFFKSDPEYGKYYAFDSGVWQKYTLAEHTSMMMRQFDRYFSSDFDSPLLTRGQFRVMLALHDIGKPVAVAELQNKKLGRENQHEYTARIIPEMIEDLGFDDKSKAIITAIPTTDIIGSLLKKHVDPVGQAKAIEEGKVITPEEAVRRVREIAEGLQVDPGELFNLMFMYFLSDASSYTHDADPKMEPPSEGDHEGLDHLFVFDRAEGEEVGQIRLIPELEVRAIEVRERFIAS